ncbi:MAG: hypothetical protein ACYS26_21440 [Planctomycetota bacterium]|jgi:hypothetical protein
MSYLDKLDKKKQLLVKCYIKHNGQIGKACKEVGVTRFTFRNYILKDEDFKQAIEEAWEARFEEVEDALLKAAKGFSVKTTFKRVKTATTPKGDIHEETFEEREKYYPPDTAAAKLLLEAKARHMGYGRKLNDPPQQSQEGEVVGSDEI